MSDKFSEITPEIAALSERCNANNQIDATLYNKYQVKRGLRDINGKGVLAGLTKISDIVSFVEKGDEMIPCEGRLYYRGINIEDIVDGFIREGRFGFEETVYLLLMGEMPNRDELEDFTALLAHYRTLPTSFVRDIIMKAPSSDMMNTLARS
ncbi:MAG: citrate/2-methylcitrate synthase, partial [Christensenellaceae bacterium]